MFGRPPGKVPKCPRIYDRFQTKDGNNERLEFISPYKSLDSHCPLLFKAKTIKNDESEEEIVVKVVGEGYGEDAHDLAAESGFAPKLYGVAKVDGAPPAYVMELLSEEQGWVPLQRAYSNVKAKWEKLEGELDKFLEFLRANNLVHGDLRGNNVLCHMDTDDVKIGVIDWDWAGRSGTARYPLTLNPAANLPANPGDLITSSHDSFVLKKYFNERKKVSLA
jgi:Phosphotransferase enzyme family